MDRDTASTNRDRIVSGPIVRTIFSLAIPVVLGMFMEFALSITDFFWVGKLGATAQDAITSSMVIQWTIFALIAIITIGVTALVSRFVGANDFAQVRFYIRQSLLLSIALGVLLVVIGYWLTPDFLKAMKTGTATLVHAVPYLRIFFISAILFCVNEVNFAIFRASGDTRTPTLVAVMAVLINIVLDPLLIFGIGPFPELGVAGAALASLVAMAVSTSVIITKLVRGRMGYTVPRAFGARPDLRAMAKILKIGLPIGTQQVTFVAVYWFLIAIVHDYGEVAGAAMGIGNRMESFSYLTCYGFSIAASTMVGQNLGAKLPDRAAKGAWGAAGLAVTLTLAMSAAFLLLPRQIAGIFTSDPEVLEIAADYLIILGLSQTTMAIEIVLEGAFSGAGDTVPIMLVQIPGAAARIPLAYWLCYGLDWGINGVWWTLTITTIVKALVLAWWFGRGRWKTKVV